MPRAGTATDQRRLHGWLAEKMMDSLLCLFLFLFLFFFPLASVFSGSTKIFMGTVQPLQIIMQAHFLFLFHSVILIIPFFITSD